MQIYWFCCKNEYGWKVIAALDEARAWELLTSHVSEFRTVELVKGEYALRAVTEITECEGVVASISPEQLEFLIHESFGSEKIVRLCDI